MTMKILNKTIVQGFIIMIFGLLIGGCHPHSEMLQPKIIYAPPQRLVDSLQSPFEPLTKEELSQDWGREMGVGIAFAKEMDLYRAITCFKTALFLIPCENPRYLQIEYYILECYYFGRKYREVIDTFENGKLFNVPFDFPAFHDLVIILFDSYLQIDQPEKAYRILCMISSIDEATAKDLVLEATINEGKLCAIEELSESHPKREEVCFFLEEYKLNTKSVRKAQILNAILPGAGYYYVGQKKSALTSFCINALFAAAAYEFFNRGYIAAGIITTSFEMGWYFGGINGAGLAAKEYNQQLYESFGKELLIQNRLFPVLMLQKSF